MNMILNLSGDYFDNWYKSSPPRKTQKTQDFTCPYVLDLIYEMKLELNKTISHKKPYQQLMNIKSDVVYTIMLQVV